MSRSRGAVQEPATHRMSDQEQLQHLMNQYIALSRHVRHHRACNMSLGSSLLPTPALQDAIFFNGLPRNNLLFGTAVCSATIGLPPLVTSLTAHSRANLNRLD